MTNIRKNFLYVFSVNSINGIAGIAFIPLAINAFGADGYGLYSIFIILTSYIYFVEMGVAKYFTKTFAQSLTIEEQKKKIQMAVGVYIRIAFLLLLLTPILFYCVPNFVFPSENPNLMGIIVILAALDYLLSIPTSIILTFNIGKENFAEVSKFNLFSGLSRHFSLILAVVISKSVIVVIIVILIRRVLDFIYSNKILKPIPKDGWKPSFVEGEFKKILSGSLLLSATQLTQVAVLTLGTFLINKHFSIREVGIYNSAFDLAKKVWLFSNSIGLVIFPRFAAMLKDEEERDILLNKIPNYHKTSWLLYNLLFLAIIFLYPLFPNFLYIEDLTLFFLLLYGVCINAHSNLSYEFLQADSRLKEVITVGILTAIIMIFVFYLEFSQVGYYSIGIAWIFGQLISSILMDYLVIQKMEWTKTLYTLGFHVSIVLVVCLLVLL